jgi:hypothetical protein
LATAGLAPVEGLEFGLRPTQYLITTS